MGDVQTNYAKLDTQIKQTSLLESPSSQHAEIVEEAFEDVSKRQIASKR